MIICPNHNGGFDCTPFCRTCYGEQEFDPTELMTCIVGDCQDQMSKDVWVEESGFCVEHSHAYYNDELDYVNFEWVS
jgi:hypothetical protein